MPRLETMRSKIAAVYNSPKWLERVAIMPDSQVIAIYHSFERSGRFDKPKKTLRKSSNSGRQLTIFDFMEGDKR